MISSDGIKRIALRITGQVQGVGYRPFMYRLALELRLTGWVLNNSWGVTIEVQGSEVALAEFMRRLPKELPPLASIASCRQSDAEVIHDEEYFEIRPSAGGEIVDAQVTVDTATCADCFREMNDSGDPRHKYPFINCTNCGPRYSIIIAVPYDRSSTTMADFEMCPICKRQYSDPADRRFHAQPVACPQCGPSVWLVDSRGMRIDCDDAISTAAEMLQAGKIVAIKGLGGFHLACRADDEHAVVRLRRRKRRDAKPFALMVADLAQAESLCEISEDARKLLAGAIHPIVICPARENISVAGAVAQGMNTLGIMLPYTPLHHLLFACGLGPMVMTSGNYSDEPLVKDNDSAVAYLGEIADAMLLHDRRIYRSLDDSVVQIYYDGSPGILRRARGYAPQPVHLGEAFESSVSVLAVGAELKSTVCLLQQGRAVLGEHIGDLKDARTYRHFVETINHLEKLFEFQAECIAADLHPQYLSSEYARKRSAGQLPGRGKARLIRVQHHHAHIAACLAEHGRRDAVIGLACDGVGYGDDGAVWGCELLKADLTDYQRLGHLRYIPLVGGDAAARQTYRPGVAVLHEAFGGDCLRQLDNLPSGRDYATERGQLQAGLEMLAAGANCPPSSSLGRWFDAIAWLCGVARENRFEGEAPMSLEAAIAPGVEDAYDFRIGSESPFQIDLAPMVEQIVADLSAGEAAGAVSAKFHNTVVAFLRRGAGLARERTGLTTATLSGGCFANRYITMHLTAALESDGFEVLRHRTVPCNDACIALGQAAVAAARIAGKSASPGVESSRSEETGAG